MASLTSTGTGYWDSMSLWSNNLPIANDIVTIANGHTVTVRESNYSMGTIGGLVWGESWVKYPDIPISNAKIIFISAARNLIRTAAARNTVVLKAFLSTILNTSIRVTSLLSRTRDKTLVSTTR